MRLTGALMLLALICGGCISPAAPYASEFWPRVSPDQEFHDVQIKQSYDALNTEGYGSGVILHSSPEKGTYVLCNWHVACFPGWYVREDENVSAMGPVNISVGVNVHARSATKPGWAEWKEVTGKAVYARYRDGVHLGLQQPGEQISEAEGAWINMRVLDIALVHFRTGAEPLKAANLKASKRDEKGYGAVQGISSEGVPFRDSVVRLNDGFFYGMSDYRSGAGVYDQDGSLVGLFWGWMSVEGTKIEDQGVEREIDWVYMSTPINLIRSELTEAGYGFLFEE